jgi:wobble nucleotide-excising tRNase
VLGLLARFVFFKEQFQEWGAGLKRIGQWEENYKAENPNATKEEMDTQFRVGIAGLEAWKVQYKKDHPDATEAEITAAFDAAWANK